MLNLFSACLMTLLVVLGISVSFLSPAYAQTNPADLAKAVEEIEYLDAMRSGLASSLEGTTEAPTLQTMKEVCKPVGMRAKQLSQDNGWRVKQIASKYRNPAHAPDTFHDKRALAKFEQDPELTGFWERETLNGQDGTRYYRRINVEASCLACHGAQGDRPQFVKDNYPQDLAYDFQVGDLRGMYAVFIPDVKQALEGALSES
ncbi:hypothetical protein XM38_043540 [Halomicronema hongdechloris C2206]|uniref:Tll0287-like domain-containing protein n=1 Tax=Halomicronema hongdechloris C2206 TaxID=1641165 RepID=A0A1Z3HSW2_9CYAN|nr:DUF3365 domain-containing protein [Halomicronema hongdechloris]ASC73389.1 hypothetical protein XM38_043540 [Halomicronema hongdechloris C2206]